MKTVTDWLTNQTVYTYDNAGNLTNTALPNGAFTDFAYDLADRPTSVVNKNAGGTISSFTYSLDAAGNGNQTSRGGDTFTYDHENRLTQSVVGGVTSSSVYNGDGLRMSHTEGVTTTNYTWDVAAGPPVAVQDDDNTYVYGLDLISATDGAGVQTYSLNDGLGSTTDLTDGSANPTDDYSYDVFGTIRSQSGSSSNYWLFTGEQRDGQPGVAGGVQRLPLDVVVSFANLTGANVPNLDDDPDDPDANWATAITVADTSIQTGFPTPPGDPTPGEDLQEFSALLRKDATGGYDPTYDIELWETGGGAPLATLISGATLSSDTGEVVSATWDASLLSNADGSAVELRIVGDRSNGPSSKRPTVEVGAVEWNVDHQGTPGSELYFLRARYYDPEIGRFLSQDPIPAVNLYAYVGNNPVTYTDPSGLFVHKKIKKTVEKAVGKVVYATCSQPQTVLPCGFAGLGPLGDSYFDLNVTVGCGSGITFGFQYKASQGFHPYGGAGVSTCSASGSFSIGYNQDITDGRNCYVQGGYNFPTPWGIPTGPAGSAGFAPVEDKEGRLNFFDNSASFFWEAGVAIGTPGFSGFTGCTEVGSLPYLSW